MKKSELEIGKVYAYSRTSNPTSLYQIGGFIIDGLQPERTYRNNPSQEVVGRYTDRDGKPQAETNTTTINIRKLIGDYKTVYHDIELADKNREIAQLKRSIKSKEITDLIKNNAELYKRNTSNTYDDEYKSGIGYYRFKNKYDGNVDIELNLEQFVNLTRRLNRLEFLEDYYEQKRKQEEEARQAQEETVNA